MMMMMTMMMIMIVMIMIMIVIINRTAASWQPGLRRPVPRSADELRARAGLRHQRRGGVLLLLL